MCHLLSNIVVLVFFVFLSDVQEETNVSLHARRMPKSRLIREKARGVMMGCLQLPGSSGKQQFAGEEREGIH